MLLMVSPQLNIAVGDRRPVTHPGSFLAFPCECTAHIASGAELVAGAYLR